MIESGRWRFSEAGYNDGATFGVSLGGPVDPGQKTYSPGRGPSDPKLSGLLSLQATNWTIYSIGNELTSYTDPSTGITYSADRCRITVSGHWQVIRQPNSNSFNSQGVNYSGRTETDQGSRDMSPWLLSMTTQPNLVLIIQGSQVSGGAQNTFSSHEFFCRITESTTTVNSNKEYQSNSIARPAWIYTYTKSWQID